MKCPFLIEPHQIQGLDFINIFPVIQWLVKRSVENRAEKAEKLKTFAVGQFHNHFLLNSAEELKQKNKRLLENVTRVDEVFGPRRQYRRRDNGAGDERTRVRITLLEYGNRGNIPRLTQRDRSESETAAKANETVGEDEIGQEEVFFLVLSILNVFFFDFFFA